MTTYCVLYKEDEIIVEVSGHADYRHAGRDIVCASISTLTIMTANLIDKLGLSYNIVDLISEEGYFRLQVKASESTTKAVVENLVDGLDSLKEQYPKYVKKKN